MTVLAIIGFIVVVLLAILLTIYSCAVTYGLAVFSGEFDFAVIVLWLLAIGAWVIVYKLFPFSIVLKGGAA